MHPSEPSFMTSLKEATRELHDEIEGVPFHHRLAQGALTLDEYRTLLEALLFVHHSLERLRSTLPEGPTLRCSQPLLHLSSALEADIQDAVAGGADLLPGPQEEAHRYARKLEASGDPLLLLGHLYVLHGSLLGGLHLRRLFLATLPLQGDEMRYFGGFGDAVPRAWNQFRGLMNREGFDHFSGARIIQAAKDCFQELISLYSSFPATEATFCLHHENEPALQGLG